MPQEASRHATPVPRLDYQLLTADVLNNLTAPVVVTGWPTPPRQLTTSELKTWLHGQVLWVYARNVGDAWQEWTAEDFVDAFSASDASPGLNVVDVYLTEPRFDAVFPVHPAFDAANLLNADPRTAHYRRSVVLTAPGAYTPMHVDSYGAGGWMYLISGEKHWELGHAEHAAALWDPATQDYADPRAGNWPAEVPTWTATLRAGEMMVCPPGFIHRVATPVQCVGFGGAFLPAGQVARGVAVWRRELALGQAGPLDLADVLHDIAANAGPQVQRAIEAALA
jgi:hypothetical protein